MVIFSQRLRGNVRLLAALAAFFPAQAIAESVEKSKEIAVAEVPEAEAVLRSGDFLSSRYAHTQGDRAAARFYLEKAIGETPENHVLSGQMMVLALAAGDMEEAVARAHDLKKIEGHEPIVNLLLAVDAVHQGRMDEAEAQFKRVFADKDSVLWQPLFLAWVDVGRGTLKNPIEMKDILPGEAEDGPAFLAYLLALANDAAGHGKVAGEQYARSLADASRAPFRAVEAAANYYRRTGQRQQLELLKAEYLAAHPEADSLERNELTAQASALIDQGGKSGKPESRLVSNAPEGVAEVLFTMASVLYAVDGGQDTMLYLRLALHLRPDFPVAQLLVAGVLEDEKRYAEAADVYARVASGGPLAERALLRRAFMVEKQGRLDEALTMLDDNARQNPKAPDAYIAKGDLLRMRGRYEDAAEAYGAAIKRFEDSKPSQWGVYFARGACYERLGRWTLAVADLRRALELNPDQPEVLNYLGYGMLTRDENIEEAKRLIAQAYDMRPASPHIIDSMGWAFYKTGDFEQAREMLEQAIELSPSDPSVNDHLGDVYWQIGRRTEARFQWERALTFSPEPEQEQAIRAKLKEGPPPVARKDDGAAISARGDAASHVAKAADSSEAPVESPN